MREIVKITWDYLNVIERFLQCKIFHFGHVCKCYSRHIKYDDETFADALFGQPKIKYNAKTETNWIYGLDRRAANKILSYDQNIWTKSLTVLHQRQNRILMGLDRWNWPKIHDIHLSLDLVAKLSHCKSIFEKTSLWNWEFGNKHNGQYVSHLQSFQSLEKIISKSMFINKKLWAHCSHGVI